MPDRCPLCGGLISPEAEYVDGERLLFYPQHCRDCGLEAKHWPAVQRLKDENAELEAFANRYSWLRSHSYVSRGEIEFGPGFNQTFPEFLDDAIERQMKYTKSGERQ